MLSLNLYCRQAIGGIYSAEEYQWMKQHPTVYYTAAASMYPMDYIEGGVHKGYAKEYIEELEKMTGLSFVFIPTNTIAEARKRVSSGDLDMHAATITQNTLNKKDMLFTQPYYTGFTYIITKAMETATLDVKGLVGKKVAVIKDSVYINMQKELLSGVNLVAFNSIDDGLAAVARGEVYAMIGINSIILPVLQRKYAGVLSIGGSIASFPVSYAFGVKKSQKILCSIINKSLNNMTAYATNKMYLRWMDETNYGAPSLFSVLYYYRYSVLIFLLVFIVIIQFAHTARVARKKAEYSEQIKTTFLAVISHEIRNPMNAILSSVELLLRTPLTPKQKELMSIANASGSALLELLDNVLDISRIGSNRVELELRPIALTSLFTSIADIHRISAEKKHLKFILCLLELDNKFAMLDSYRLQQILSNLLSNAIKFTSEGEIVFAAELNKLEDGNIILCIKIIDTGIGISQERQLNLFTPFVQADNSTTRNFGGSGLGLAICKRLIKLMGGDIQLKSQQGRGTEVLLSLPIELVTHSILSVDGENADIFVAPKLGLATVLVVDDHPLNQVSIGNQLKELGYPVSIAQSGPIALALLNGDEREKIGMILLDCFMPKMDGYEVARRIRAHEELHCLAPLPIIAISAAIDDQHREQCIKAGMNGVLSKPLRIIELEKLLRLWLGDKVLPLNESVSSIPQDLSKLFIDAALLDWDGLTIALQYSDYIQAREHAHRIYGSALVVGADAIADVAVNLERCFVNANKPVADLQYLVAKLRSELDAFKAQNPAK
ncbi:ATP-binding protein [Iodobacter sp. CM08]|uniref:ATP-binding protein n=1 Tax=Iodobacter sp. CM08 TaxID=3085902 RepID=UPI0029825D5D|nr:transporter substrate-binding domain-containing protein [Iodobacter sp. CM08]MDW5415916.1 ATP-binding protein [Iodobacter sp. CM08]